MTLMRLWTPRALALAAALDRGGYEARIVGGAVRDALAGAAPKDTDLATTATPREMLALAKRLGLRTFPSADQAAADPTLWERGGLKHGTVSFVVDGEVLEATTLRADAACDGRRAEVAFVRDFETDADRRDFTFNAMSVDRGGRLHDYFGGAADLGGRKVRFVGDAAQRIAEDYLRILRFFRFRARLGAPADERDTETLAAVAAGSRGLRLISGERIWLEMAKILAVPGGADQLWPMAATGVAREIGLAPTRAAVEAAKAAAARGAPPEGALALLLAGDGWEGALEGVRQRWRLGNAEAALVRFVCAHADLAGADWLAFADLATRPRARADHVAVLLRCLGRAAEADEMERNPPAFPLRGADLVEAGLARGPAVGEALEEARRAWLADGCRCGRDELVAALGGGSPRPR